MTIKITIIGTGQIGASIGLALGAQKDLFLRVGHDKDIKIANRAKDMGAVDKVEINLFRAIDRCSDCHPGASPGPDSAKPSS